jgi:hypothetical protein
MTTCAGKGVSFWDLSEEEQAKIPEAIRDGDWCEAFGYAPFAITDVVEVIHVADGENDSDNWVGVFRLVDGTFGYVCAGCDYTGWGCQAGGAGEVRATLEEILTEACTDDDRRRFGVAK